MEKTVMAEYIFRDMESGELWVDVYVDRQPYIAFGPFDTEGERQRLHDDLIKTTRSVGAVDVPATSN